MEDYALIFRQKLSGQVEVCARKALEILQKDLQGQQKLSPEDIYYLSMSAQVLLSMRDAYGKK
jgi:hypothetical protein